MARMFIYKSRFLSRAEVWYDNEPDDTRSVDWILYCRRSHPVVDARSRLVHTYCIDLKQTREQLQANLNKDNAYKIRRARERDKIVCECCNPCDAEIMDRFEQMYNVFAEMKGLAPLYRPRMESMAAAGVLDMSVAKDAQGNPLVYHADYRDHRRATSMELPSLYRKVADSAERNFIGRANRYLTWTNILRYQDEGLAMFDFGGWYQGVDPAMIKINDFKRGFGGEIIREYECEQTLTLKGKVVLGVAAMLDKAKRVAQARASNSDSKTRVGGAADDEESGQPGRSVNRLNSGRVPAENGK